MNLKIDRRTATNIGVTLSFIICRSRYLKVRDLINPKVINTKYITSKQGWWY